MQWFYLWGVLGSLVTNVSISDVVTIGIVVVGLIASYVRQKDKIQAVADDMVEMKETFHDQIKTLEEKVNKHSNIGERIAVIANDIAWIKRKLGEGHSDESKTNS